MQHHDVIRFRQKPCPPRGIALALGRLAGFATWRAGRAVRGRRPVGAGTDTVRIPRFAMATGYDDSASLAEKLRTRALRVEVVAPRGRVLPAQGGPPALTLRVLSRGFARDSLTCFATGQGRAGVVWLDRQRREVQVRAVAPLPVGRSKYTCTAPVPGRPGAYFWFSHRWLKPRTDGSWPGG